MNMNVNMNMNMNMTMNMNMNMTMNRTNGGISNTVEQLTMNTQETTMKNNDSRVSVLPVKDEWCTGRGIPRLTARVLQVGVIFESNNFLLSFS